MNGNEERSIFTSNHRQMSEFIAKQLIYEYLTDKLDDTRKRTVEKMLEQSPGALAEFGEIKSGLDFCDSLSQVEVSEKFIEELEAAGSFWRRFFEGLNIQNWPRPIKWSLEGLAIAIVVALVVSRLPIEKFLTPEKDPMLLAQVDHTSGAKQEFTLSPEVKPKAEEDIKKNKATTVASAPTASERPPEIVIKPAAPKNPPAEAKAKPKVSQTLPQQVPDRPMPAKNSGNAFVFRMYMYRKDVDKVNPDMVKLIEGLSGAKAGQVELGWRKEKGRYFHFKLPENNHDSLLNGLKEFGSIRIRKSKHSRVMPAGTFRYILWVEEANL